MQLHARLLDAIGHAVVATDAEGIIIYWNRAAETLYGWSADEMRGKRAVDVIPHDFNRDEAESILRSAQRGESWHGEIELRHMDGSTFTAALTSAPVFDDDGKTCAIIGVSTDVTERKRAERRQRELEEQFRLAAETIPDILFTLTSDGRVDYVNERFTEWTGLPIREAHGDNWSNVLHPDDVRVAGHLWKAARESGAPIEQKHRICTKGGTYRWFITRARPIRNNAGKVVRWFGTSTDIDDLVRAEEAIKELNTTLEERVAERTAQVKALSSALTLAEQRERRRITRLLHDDVQQQLYGLKLKSELVGQDLRQNNEDLEAIFHQIRAGFDEAIQSIESLTIELSPPVLEGEGLGLALEWLGLHMQRTYGVDVKITVDGECSVRHQDQRVLIFQFVRELLSNVVKHAHVDAAEVRLRRKGSDLYVEVIDEGTGFETDRMATDDGSESWGLFSIRERLALFGGRLDINSRPGAGTKVTIVTPLHISA